MSLRSLFVLAASAIVVTASGCACGDPNVTVQPDSGEVPPECSTTADCQLGQSCVDGKCVVGEVDDGGVDAGVECTEHTDCPQGFVCLKSENRCIPQENPPDAGEQDAGFTTCFENDTRPCGPSKLGECRLGTETCLNNAWGTCAGAVLPTSEACDQKDNDCNGLVDDPYNKLTDVNNCGLCGTVCSYPNATALCSNGTCAMGACSSGFVDLNNDPADGCEYACSPSNGGTEICDGKDNDCDGQTDESLPDLSCGQGACAKTVTACISGQPQTCVPGAATAEVCDGIDNNCDGTADNGLSNLTCGQGECFRSVPACNGTSPNTCTPGTGNSPVEVCTAEFKGKDDDCDGMVDENCACTGTETQSCYSGSPGTAGTGVCVAGTQTCNGGAWGSCAGEVKDTAEICDGLDNDCDGQTDEGLPVLNCGNGECARTVSTCINGQPNSTCTAGNPATEVCDSKDNDCDNATDEGTISCGQGACTVTVAMCTATGANNTCVPGVAQTEICDGVDNNCDNAIDESYPQMGQSCATGVPGVCATGTRSCSNGTLGCQQTKFPSNEICNNNLDENCNGTNDDPLACGCDATIDRDLDGVSQCLDCNDTDGTIKPDAGELCNGRDDNCNTQIDETFDKDQDTFTTCGTVPGGGIDTTRIDCKDDAGFVFPGKVTDCGNQATPATANGIDDNCNGYVDETCNCDNVDRDGDGLSQCQGDCAPNDGAIRPGRTEICDGKDNDCDKDTVDNCGVSEPCGYKSGPSYVAWPAGTDQCKPDLLCTRNTSTGAMTCGSLCNQTQGAGLGDSCAAGEGCNVPLLDTDALAVCRVTPVGTKLTGATCSGDSECRSGDCATGGFCTDLCTHQSGCSANTTCTPSKYVTDYQGPFPIGYLFSSNCKLNSTISGNKNLGENCNGSTSAPECKSGVEGCFNGKCTVPCCASSECGAGYGCSLAGPRVYTGYTSTQGQIYSAYAACLPSTGKTQGQVCATSAECKSGICDKAAGTCVDVCCNDSTCTNGTTCELVDFKWSDGKFAGVRVCMKLPLPAILEQK